MTESPRAPHEIDGERIEDIDISQEMEGSFLEYAYSVIYSRALPDARDGLKPVQRRILYMMDDMGLRPDKGHVKSARVVGEVMGKLHPHGDSSIYDALVRMAQSFNMRLPLVDGHGNFGSLDDGPAASRYTEARLAGAALAMTDSLHEDVVDFVPNYDNQLMQPEVLPSAVPNLLVNGASGIAVGMATNLAPHNLIEVVDGAKHLLHHPKATVEELMEFIPGPDLPGGGTIVGLDGVKDAYRTGRGAFRTRAKVAVEQLGPRRTGLVVTELPYLVGPERVIEKIKQGVEAKKLSGIADVADLTDRKNGLRLVITLKTGFAPEAVLEQLYRYTPLEDSFSINSVALVQGQPQTLGLREMLRVFLDHRLDVITRRSKHRLAKRRDRLHLVEGLLIAILDIDEVIQLIRTSDDSETARTRLMQVFDLSEAQAEYILELRLRRLTKFSRVELEAERDELNAEIAKLLEILGSDARLRKVVADELDQAAAAWGTPRRTLLTGAVVRPTRAAAASASLQVADSPCTVQVSATGRALRIDRDPDAPETPRGASRATKHGAVLASVEGTVRGEFGAVLSDGTLHRFTPVDLPVVPAASVAFSAGVKLTEYLGLSGTKLRVVGVVPLDQEQPVGLATAQGVVKRVVLTDLPAKPEFEVIGLKAGDQLLAAFPAPDGSEFALVTSDAQLLRFDAGSVRPQGRPAGGMAGIRLGADARVVFAGAVPADAEARVVTVADSSITLPGTDVATAKVTDWAEIPPKGRATGGVRIQRFLKWEDQIACAWVGTGEPRALAADGAARKLPSELGKRDGSGQPIDGAAAYIGAAP
ncbi:DNA gyrase/topoisomerase IV subunit A [Leucobacter chromiireducens]|uniref:DNA topoisomerase (ATP-hydrolyzing) n=1 Tax=Leucobacter chromiireducens subsp. solipictus TaxID=398235 RepID=A0ABS1SH74_9MICO|nr:DNA topoisomerase IV subunit A [Leucobacter chromiireducens]MBL3679382.1 DNA topoisomerase IV subunit A [Leucobacter chromiireducens subsp. solipictus]